MFLDSQIVGICLLDALQSQDHGPQEDFGFIIGRIDQSDTEQSVFFIDAVIQRTGKDLLHPKYRDLGCEGNHGTHFIESLGIRIGMTGYTVLPDLSLIIFVNIDFDHGLCFDRSNFNAGEGLTMTLAFAIVALCFVFENKDLISFALSSNLCSDFSAFYSRFANLDIPIAYNGQDVIENDFVAFLDVQFFNFQDIPFADTILFTTSTDNSVRSDAPPSFQDSPNTVLLPEFLEPLRAVVLKLASAL